MESASTALKTHTTALGETAALVSELREFVEMCYRSRQAVYGVPGEYEFTVPATDI